MPGPCHLLSGVRVSRGDEVAQFLQVEGTYSESALFLDGRLVLLVPRSVRDRSKREAPQWQRATAMSAVA
jgi:hypothetical protein